jgi:hypothetical protein
MNGSTMLIATLLACAGLSGAIFALPAALAPLAKHLDLAEGRPRVLRTLFLVLLVPMMLVGGLLIDKWGVQTVLLTGGLLATLALVLMERGGAPRAAAGAMALLAAAEAALTTGSVVAMPHAFFPDNAGRSVCLGGLAVLAGALLSLVVVRLLTRRLEPRKVLLIMALGCLVPAGCVALTPAEDFAQPPTGVNWVHLFTDVRLPLVGLVVLLAAPLEAGLAGWTRRYVVEHGYLPGAAAVRWGGFWVAFLAARLAAALLLPPGGEAVLVLLAGLLTAVALGNMLSEYAVGSILGLWLVGACCGPLLPAALGLTLRAFTADPGPAVGIVSAAGALSTLALQPVLGRSTRGAMRLSTGLALMLLGPALVLALAG